MSFLPGPTEYDPYYNLYLKHMHDQPLEEAFMAQKGESRKFWESLSAEEIRPYASGKWTLVQIVQHLIDTERIFNFRALYFARGGQADLPGFDHNAFAREAGRQLRAWSGLLADYQKVRASTEALYISFSERELLQQGQADGNPFGVRALGYITLGHERHHQKVLREKYL